MFRDISPTHLGLILFAFVLLFGYRKLPDATRSLGRSLRIFRSEVRSLHEDGEQQRSVNNGTGSDVGVASTDGLAPEPSPEARR